MAALRTACCRTNKRRLLPSSPDHAHPPFAHPQIEPAQPGTLAPPPATPQSLQQQLQMQRQYEAPRAPRASKGAPAPAPAATTSQAAAAAQPPPEQQPKEQQQQQQQQQQAQHEPPAGAAAALNT